MGGGWGCGDAAMRATGAGIRVEGCAALLAFVPGKEKRLRALDTAPSVTNWFLCSTRTGQYFLAQVMGTYA